MEEQDQITEDGRHDDARGNGRAGGAATAERGRTQRPPYTSQADLDHLFDRMTTMREPREPVDSEWVKSFGLAATQPSAAVSALKWLGVVDDEGVSTGAWDELRNPETRRQTLKRLMEESYSEIFERIDVTGATPETLQGAFIIAYASGDPRRPITCFLSLCRHAGIETSMADRRSGASRAERSDHPKRGEPKRTRTREQPEVARRNAPPSIATEPPISVSLNVEIPADWSDDRARDRIATIRSALAR